jgi:putative transposase
VRRLLFRTIHDIALMLDRERERREQSPTAAVVDRQSIKAPAAQKRGFNAGKKVVGRNRHIAVNTDCRLLMVNLTTADNSDSAGRDRDGLGAAGIKDRIMHRRHR